MIGINGSTLGTSAKELPSYSSLKNLCGEILKDVDSYTNCPPKIRAQAIKNRSRSLLLTETQKIAEKYNKIGDKYRYEEDFNGVKSMRSQKKLRVWPKALNSSKLKDLPSNLKHLNISLVPLANPDPYTEENPVFPQITADELRKLQKSMKNGSMEKLLQKYENVAAHHATVEATDLVRELREAMTAQQLDSLDSIISEYDGFDAALKTKIPLSVTASAEMLKKFKALHFQAAAAMGNFERLIAAINNTLGSPQAADVGSPGESKIGGNDEELCSIYAEIGPLKLMSRSVEKAVNDYNSDPSQILDFLRASVYCNSISAMDKVMNVLRTIGQSEFGAHILRVKNGFESIAAVSTYGYRDIKVNIWIPCDPVLVQAGRCLAPERAGIIAEIQLHLKEMYDVKANIGHMMYTWVRKFDLAGITSPEILLTFGVRTAEATVALCAGNVKMMIECIEADPESNRCEEIDARLCDEDVEPFLDGTDKDDLRLSNELAMNIMTSRENRRQMDERIGREAETLLIYVKYRSIMMGVEMNDYHVYLPVEIAKCVRPLRDLALGRLPTVLVPDSHMRTMNEFVAFLEESLGMTPELLNLLRHLNEGYCKGRSFHLMRATTRVALKIYGSTSHPMYLATVVNVFHSSMWGMINYFNAFVDDVLLNYSSRRLENVKFSSKVIVYFTAEDSPSLREQLIEKAEYKGRNQISFLGSRFLVLMALPFYPLRVLCSQEERQILFAPFKLRILSTFTEARSNFSHLRSAHPLCSFKSFAWIIFLMLQLDASWIFICYSAYVTEVNVFSVGKLWLSAVLVFLSVSALMTYFSLNPHRRPRSHCRYATYLCIMRSYLYLSLFSLAIAIYALAVLKEQPIVVGFNDDSQTFIEASVEDIFFVWIALGALNLVYYLRCRLDRVTYKSLNPSADDDAVRNSSVDSTS